MKDEKDLNKDNENKEINAEDLSYQDQRSLIFHLLYAADSFDYDATLESVADNFYKGYNILIPQNGTVFKEAQAIISNRENLDEDIKPLVANWRFDRIGIMTLLILRLAVWELKNTNKDSTLIINEAVELAQGFAEKDAYKFVNGILDEYAKKYLDIDQDTQVS